MNNHIIVGENNRCLCGIFEGKTLSCAEIIKAIEVCKKHGQSWDGGLLARIMETLIKDVEAETTNPPNTMNDDIALQKWLAERLPEKLQFFFRGKALVVEWKERVVDKEVRPTEWDYIVKMMEQKLSIDQKCTVIKLREDKHHHPYKDFCIFDDWQTRTRALKEIWKD